MDGSAGSMKMKKWRNNLDVVTPNGPGVVVGVMEEDGLSWVVVRHQLCRMTGSASGRCLSPQARVSGLWQYEPDEVNA